MIKGVQNRFVRHQTAERHKIILKLNTKHQKASEINKGGVRTGSSTTKQG